MKTLLKLALVAMVPMALGACASSQTAVVKQPPAPGSVITDQAYIAYVERVARRRGITVQWVNMPRQRVPDRQ